MIKSNSFTWSKGKNGGYVQGTTQNWNIGEKVNVGFLKGLEVISIEAIKDGKPDVYTLQSAKGVKYEFIPHNGIHRID